eukprot:12421301-Heterocapsa_arctica.AAC.1
MNLHLTRGNNANGKFSSRGRAEKGYKDKLLRLPYVFKQGPQYFPKHSDSLGPQQQQPRARQG